MWFGPFEGKEGSLSSRLTDGLRTCVVRWSQGYGLEQLLRSLTAYLGMDGEAYLKELTRLDAPEGVMVDGQWFTHQCKSMPPVSSRTPSL